MKSFWLILHMLSFSCKNLVKKSWAWAVLLRNLKGLASDLDSAKDSLRCVHDDLHVEKGIRDKLEGTVAEYDICKMTITGLVQEMTDLTNFLENKTKKSVNLASDLDNVKQNYKFLQDDFLVHKGVKDKLESTIGDLERSKMTISELILEKQDFIMLLESKSKESVKLA
ncbi:hypothetical protein POM88_005544 [Heracleum sosnowskyi]|uniref:Uncharacterized protein n=1 Tax=Heracleum sosnowskyi TaxID=360622 RepID=A0AAD8J3N5_9APIA|nr:hypothetical protein POM88_005544 [Heracleum sosnowskyi]